MLPTTKYFKSFNCPFYDTCICERPYCHFKHCKRETINDINILSDLVAKAVHKVLNSNINFLKETNEKPAGSGRNVTYNPTSIAELNKYKTNNATKQNSENRNRHIPTQYTLEQPRSFCSTVTSNYNNSLEYSIDDNRNTIASKYRPSSNVHTSVSYIPSSIKTLTASNSISDSLIVDSHTNVTPFNLKLDESKTCVLTAEYSPTKTLFLDNAPSYSDYVPKYNDEFINDPIDISVNAKDTTNQQNDNNNLKNDKIESKSIIDISKSSKEEIITEKKREVEQLPEEAISVIPKQKKDSKPSSSSSNKKTPDANLSSSRSSHSKHSSRHKDKGKDRQKEEHVSDKKEKHSDEKQRTHRSRSKSRDKKKKCEKSPVNKNKVSENPKNSEHKTTLKDNRDNAPISDDLFDSTILDLSDESDDELEQCKRIFEEYQPSVDKVQQISKKHSRPEPAENGANSIVSKKRVAHEKSSSVIRKQTIKHPAVETAALVMANRYKQILANIKEKHDIAPSTESSDNLSHSTQLYKRPFSKILEMPTDLTHSKPNKLRRIAHVPNVSLLLNAKRKVDEFAKAKITPKTPMQTVTKGNKRVAHIPDVTIADIPSVLQSEKSKLPVNVRNKYLFLMVKECVKLYVSKKAAYERALNEELICYSKCSVIVSYRNSIMLSINRLRKEAELDFKLTSSSSSNNSSDFIGKKFYDNISKWILTKEELLDNGYPRPGALKNGFALFKESKQIEKIPENCQLCARCKKIYKVDDNCFQMYPEDCIYHPGKRFVFGGETKYICCKESSSGCCICSNHVFDIMNPADLTGFVSTFVPENSDDPKSYAVYAVDCEMVYTTRGFELARITVIDSKLEVVYESMIKPTGHILDCNTRFSGLTTEMLETVSTRITDVQATLLLMFNSKTILIGHSLESDLKALRLIHSTIIDTSVLFPHKMGPPKKRSLRELASDYLKKIIQNDEGGHDSAEDAITCMELIIWKLKEELKLR